MAQANLSRVYDGQQIEVKGMQFIVSLEHDDNSEAPWERSEGHGPVSEWTTRHDKRPGEWIVSMDRNSRRYYDSQEAMRLAKRDGWGLCEKKTAQLALKLGRAPTIGEIRAEAVRVDFEFLRGWCADDWHYLGVCVRHVSQDEDERYGHAVWGIESCSEEYIAETAYELAERCAAEINREIESCKEKCTRYRTETRALIAEIRDSATFGPHVCNALKMRVNALRAMWGSMNARINELQGA